ncbi:MAG: hypothetical protein F4153_00895 [Acidimicrobiia bacterium]|nr:hypothetical protein [Acidimicrobiia bacterium]
MSTGRSDGQVYYLEFSDAPSDLNRAVVRLTLSNPYLNAPSGTTRNRVTVSVFDEYGLAVSAARATLTSDKSTSLNLSATIGRGGTRSFSYDYSGIGRGEVEKLTVVVDPDGSGTTYSNLQGVDEYMFWPELTATRDTTKAKAILFGNTGRNEIIVDIEDDLADTAWPIGTDAANPDTVPERVLYDTNDRFDVQGPSDTAPRPVRSVEEFEKALAEFLVNTPDGDAGTGACLSWSDYDPGRTRFTAEFRLWRLAQGQTCDGLSI